MKLVFMNVRIKLRHINLLDIYYHKFDQGNQFEGLLHSP